MNFSERRSSLNTNITWKKVLNIFLHFKKKDAFLGLIVFIIILFTYTLILKNLLLFETTDNEIKDQTNYILRPKLLKSFQVQKGSIELQERISFPRDELENEGIFFVLPHSMCLNQKGNIFITDYKDNNIQKYDLRGNYLSKIGRGGQAPGELLKPKFIRTDIDNNLYVFDAGNNRIQIFNSKGEYIKSFKLFKSYIGMSVNEHGLIFLSPLTSDLKEPLVEVLNDSGNLIHSFGKRIKFKHNTIAHNEVFLSINEIGEIYVAWANFPIVRRYSSERKLISEYKINYKLIRKLAKPNYKMKMINRKIRVRNVIAGINAEENKFYLLITNPRIEILELDLEGKILNIYWKDYANDFYAMDFLVSEDTQDKFVFFYILRMLPHQEVKVFSNR